jgi:hypothetical protein
MAGNLVGYEKIDIALSPTSIASAADTCTKFFPLRSHDKALFIVTCGTMSATGAIAMSILQSQTASTATVSAIGTYATMGADVTGMVLTNVESAHIISSSGTTGLVDSTLVINEVTYTFSSTGVGGVATATSDFAAARLIATSSVMLPDGIARTWHHLAAYVNHGVYGVKDVTATVSAGTSTGITFTATEPGDVTIDLTAGTLSTDMPIYSDRSVGYMECHGAELATSSDYDHVALQVTPSTVAHIAISLVRGSARYSPDPTALTGDSAV